MPDANLNERKGSDPWGVVKAFALIALISCVCYKLLVTAFQLVADFPALMSLLLALFSVALAALFYFKATETSNTFYDNTYKFTKDIAGLLVRMESGFGERDVTGVFCTSRYERESLREDDWSCQRRSTSRSKL